MKIAIFLPDLRPGGAERMRLQMATEWRNHGLDVDFILCNAVGELLQMLPPGIGVIDLKAERMRKALLPLVRYLKREQPDVLLAAMWPLTVIAPIAARLAGFRGRVVVSEHNNMTAAYASRGAMHRFVMGMSMRLGYALADAVVGVSKGVVDDLMLHTGQLRDKFYVIYNPASVGLDGSKTSRPLKLNGRNRVVLSVGTLKQQKRHDLLIAAFARLPTGLGATLCILGEGAKRSQLERQIVSLGLEGRVLLPGFVADPLPWYAHADLFVLSSDYEGFGNVIVEAMEQGTPIVSTDCPSGPREILEDGKYGTLTPVGDVEALADAMLNSLISMHDKDASKKRAQDFTIAKAANSYLSLFVAKS